MITLDWPAGTVTVHAPAGAAAELKRTGVPVRIATGDSGRFYSALLPVAASRGGLWFLLDSGNIRGTLVARHVARDGRLTIAENGDAVLTIGARPPVTLRMETADLDIDGALGAAWLLLGPVTLDLRGAAARQVRAARREGGQSLNWASARMNLYRSSSTSSCIRSEVRNVSITCRRSSSSQVSAMSAYSFCDSCSRSIATLNSASSRSCLSVNAFCM